MQKDKEKDAATDADFTSTSTTVSSTISLTASTTSSTTIVTMQSTTSSTEAPANTTAALSTTISTTVSTTVLTTVLTSGLTTIGTDIMNQCADPPKVANGKWICNRDIHTNGVICTNQCDFGFGFSRQDFYRQEIICKCITQDQNEECRWTQRSRVIKEATETLPQFWRPAIIPQCTPNTQNSQTGKLSDI